MTPPAQPCTWCRHGLPWHGDRAIASCAHPVRNPYAGAGARHIVVCPCPGWNSPGPSPDLTAPITNLDLALHHQHAYP